MRNIDFLIKFLDNNESDYWIVQKQYYKNSDILFIATPLEILGYKINPNELLFSKIKYFYNMDIRENFFLSTKYPPFQTGQTLGSFIAGFPIVNCKTYDFFIECLKNQSHDLYFYNTLMKKFQHVEEEN